MRSFGIALAFALCFSATAAHAQSQSVGEIFRDCSDCPEMVVIPAGSFMMGSPDGEAGRAELEGPQRRITVPRPIAVGRFEVTRDQFAAFVASTGHESVGGCYIAMDGDLHARYDARAIWRSHGFTQAGDHPVVCVTHTDALAYVAWLNTFAAGYRLPSEAEWEFFARAGTDRPFYNGSDPARLCEIGNSDDSACSDGARFTARVGSYAPNLFGIHDSAGNVSEWVADCYLDAHVAPLAQLAYDGSPFQQTSCDRAAMRGGNFESPPALLRSAHRSQWAFPMNYANGRLGFRVVRDLH
jgi:formylglycine-generating enzyme required for sulfatase activity